MKTLFKDIAKGIASGIVFMILLIGICALTGHLNTRCTLLGWIQSVGIFTIFGIIAGIVAFLWDVIEAKLKERFIRKEDEAA